MARRRAKSLPVQFTCGHCGHVVTRAEGEIWRNHCPRCLWSKHVEFGVQLDYPPCGGMMRPVPVGNEDVVWRCLGCGFTMRCHTDDYLVRAAAGVAAFGGDVVATALFYGDGEAS